MAVKFLDEPSGGGVTFLEEETAPASPRGVTFLDEAPAAEPTDSFTQATEQLTNEPTYVPVSAPITAGLSGSNPASYELPTASPEQAQEAEQAAAVGGAVIRQTLLPSQFNYASRLPYAGGNGLYQQARDADAEAQIAIKRAASIDPLNFAEKFQADQERDQLVNRAQAMTQYAASKRPETIDEITARRFARNIESVSNKLLEEDRANGGSPPVGVTTLSHLAGGLLNQISELAPDAVSPDLRNLAAGATEYSNVRSDTAGQVERGIGGIGSMIVGNPAGKLGLLAGALRGALQTHAEVLQQTGDKNKADEAALETVPMLAAYMLTGAAASKFGRMIIPKDAAPMIKGLSSFAGAEVANVGTSAVIHAANNQPYDLSALTADTLLAVLHMRGEYQQGVTESGREEVRKELLSRGFTEEQLKAKFEPSADKVSLALIPRQTQGEPGDYGRPTITKLEPTTTTNENAQQITSASPSDGGLRTRSEVQGVPAEESSQGIQPSGQGGLAAAPRREAPPEITVNDIAPAIKVGDQTIVGEPGQTHLQILNEFIQQNPEQAANAVLDFDSKTNPNFFVTKGGDTLTREQLKQQFGVSDSQGIAKLQQENARNLGPGAANIEEGLGTFSTSNKEAVVNRERAERGLDPVIKEAKITNADTIDRAETILEQNPNRADAIVDRLRTNPQERNISLEDAGILLVQRTKIRTDRDVAAQRMNDPNATPEEVAQATEDFQFLEEKLNGLDQAAQDARSTWGRWGQLWQRSMRSDWTLAPMESRARIAKGEPLTSEELADVKRQSDEIQRTQRELDLRRDAADETASIDAAKTVVAETAKYHPKVLEYAEGIVSRWEAEAIKARKDIREAMGLASANPLQFKVAAAAFKIARARIARGLLDVTEFTREMVGEFGDKIKSFIQPAWDKALKMVGGLDATKERKKSAKEVAKENAAAEEAKSTEDGIKSVVAGGEKSLAKLTPYIKQLAKEYIQSGVNTVETLETKLHDFFSPLVPDITKRQLRDAFSDYGKSKSAPTDPIKITASQLRTESQKLSALEALMAKQAPLRTGQQRVEQSDRSRQLQKKINALKNELGIIEGDPAKRLKSTLEAMETRMQNRINDLRFEIAKGERTVKTKTAQPTSPKIEALRAELSTVEAEHKAVFGDRKMTDEQRLKGAINAAKRAEQSAFAELENAKKGIFTKPAKRGVPRSAELEAIRARATAAREETKALKDAANPPLSDAQKRLDAALIEKEKWQQVLAGEITPSKKLPKEALTQLEEDARLEISSMRELVAQMRKDALPKADPESVKEQQTIKALEKAAAEYERRLNEADFSAKGKTQTVDTKKVSAARALKDAARAAYEAAKEATTPKRTPEEIAVQSQKAQLARRNAELADRIANGDFTPKPKKPPLDLSRDPEAVRLKAENERLKEEYRKARFEDEQRRRSLIQKTTDAVKETLAASRSLITSADVSAPFRQGGFLLAGDLVFHPVRAARQLGTMFHQLASEKGFQKAQAAISLRPNADLYRAAGLYFADLDSKLSAREENMRSNLAEKIPLLGRIVRASNRAYSGFLNRQRADSFDAMIEAAGGAKNVTADGAKLIANAVNVMTGRGNIGTDYSAAGAANFLARYLFSPRFLLSRFQTLTGQPLRQGLFAGKGLATERKVIALQYAKFATALAAFYGLAQLAGGRVGKDPTSSDLGKVIIGDTRIDPLVGLQQIAVLLARSPYIGTGKTTNIQGRSTPTNLDTYYRFARSKLAPIPGAIADLIAKKNVVGEPVTVGSTIRNLTVPMSYQDVGSLYREHGPFGGSVLEILNLLGMGVNQYSQKPKR